ncbi:hypothetical protein B0H14DRAFT_3573006 [Mycena olivaceomarginata]|nr:hypothetical protein B0H14DRAFT_3573006 [Mycena olivaceomarginata]
MSPPTPCTAGDGVVGTASSSSGPITSGSVQNAVGGATNLDSAAAAPRRIENASGGLESGATGAANPSFGSASTLVSSSALAASGGTTNSSTRPNTSPDIEYGTVPATTPGAGPTMSIGVASASLDPSVPAPPLPTTLHLLAPMIWQGCNPDARRVPRSGNTEQLKKQQCKERREKNWDGLLAAIGEAQDKLAGQIEQWSHEYNIPVHDVEKEVRAVTTLKKHRKPNVWCAKVWEVANELNEEKDRGDRLGRDELNAAVHQRELNNPWSEEGLKDLMTRFEAHRTAKDEGTRASNAEAARDVTNSTDWLLEELK